MEMVAERFQGDVLLEMGIDIVDDGTDDVVLPSRRRSVIAFLGKKNEKLYQLRHEKGVNLVLILELLDIIVETIEIEEVFHRIGMERVQIANPFSKERWKNGIRELEDIALVWDLKITNGEMVFSARNEDDIAGLKLSAFRFHMVNDISFDEVENLVEIMHVSLEVFARRG